uniref:KIAA1755 n=1 Tax=Anas platyrhynchos TaxID=8839 RepID=A0A8B9SRH0_ANAPL
MDPPCLCPRCSLDAAVQGALRALYPPFEATAPTVLGQVFRLLETSYRGDGLCCLLEFLIPAKRLFEHVRQAACAPYFNCIFLHEGWPLCLHEKVVVHLAPLNPLLLRSGDFYLQAEPCEEHSARIIVKHLSHDLRSVEETPIPEATYALLFTNEWLEEINCDHAGPPLHTCLVATENGIAPLPWSKIATPEFIDKPKAGPDTVPTGAPGGPAPEPAAAITPAPHSTPSTPEPYSNITGTIPGCKDASWKSKQGRYPGLIKVDQAASRQTPAVLAVPSLQEIISQNLEGEYVDLLDLSQEKLDLLARSLPPAHPLGQGAAAVLPWASGGPGVGSWPRVGGPSSQEGPCSPCQKRRLSGEPGLHGPRCRHRDSYLAALQNPVSFGPGLMAAILEEPDGPVPPAAPCKTPTPRGSRAGHPSSPPLLTHRPHRARPGVTGGEVAGPGSPRLPPAPARSEAAGSGHKFSFLKGPRLGTAPGDGSASQHEGGWKKVSAIYSPRMGRAKAAGKGDDRAGPQGGLHLAAPPPFASSSPLFPRAGMDAAAAAPTEDRSLQSTSVQNGPAAPRSRQPPGWQELHAGLLRSGIVCLPGGTDKLGRALLQVTTSGSAWGASWCSATELAKLLLCLCSLPRKDTKDSGLTAVVDARRQPPSPALFSALRSLHAVPGEFLGLGPGGTHEPPAPQVETLTSLKALGRYVDSSQVTAELDGTFPYCHGEWVQFFQKLHPFTASLRRASELLQSCIQELRRADGLAGTQDAAACIGRHQELMRRVLSDPQLVCLQREGGAVLARLRREAARLSTSPHVRASMEAAEGLYNQLEEEVHDLVSQSNSCLERLEFLRKVRELEAEFGKVSGAAPGAGQSQSPVGTAPQTRVKHGGSPAGCPEALQCLESSFQKLSVEFSMEKLQEMQAQVRRMQSSSGLGAWTEAWHKYQETRQILEEMLAELREAWGAQADGQGGAPSSSGSAAPAHPAAPSPERAGAEGAVQDSGQPTASSAPGPAVGMEPGEATSLTPKSPQPRSEGVQEGEHTSRCRRAAGGSLPKCDSGAQQGAGGNPSQERSPPRQTHPSTPPPQAGFLGAARLCPPLPSKPLGRGTAAAPSPRGQAAAQRADTTQYFQVSSHSSFSSEDSDSQTSTEEAPAGEPGCAPGPAEPPAAQHL